jgi:predicted O-methyltransferase YrrM
MLKALISSLTVIVLLSGCPQWLYPQEHLLNDLDKRVRAFLTEHAGQWDYMSVPEADGKLLYGIIVRNKYTRALEIGTSTGHSAIWIAWALSKTGGKLLTVENC